VLTGGKQAPVPALEEITAPALICGGASGDNLHSRGSFRGCKRIPSAAEFLDTHRGGTWLTLGAQAKPTEPDTSPPAQASETREHAGPSVPGTTGAQIDQIWAQNEGSVAARQ